MFKIVRSSKYNDLVNDRDRLGIMATTSNSRMNVLHESYERMRKDNARMGADLTAARDDRDRLAKELFNSTARLSGTLKEQRVAMDRQDAERTLLRNRADARQKDLDIQKANVMLLSDIRDSQKKMIEKLSKQLEEAAAERDAKTAALQKHLDSAGAQYNDMLASLKKAKEDNRVLNAALDTKESEARKLADACGDWNLKVRTLIEEKQALRQELDKGGEQYKSLQTELVAAHAAKDHSATMNVGLSAHLKQCGIDCISLRAELTKAKEEIRALKQELDRRPEQNDVAKYTDMLGAQYNDTLAALLRAKEEIAVLKQELDRRPKMHQFNLHHPDSPKMNFPKAESLNTKRPVEPGPSPVSFQGILCSDNASIVDRLDELESALDTLDDVVDFDREVLMKVCDHLGLEVESRDTGERVDVFAPCQCKKEKSSK